MSDPAAPKKSLSEDVFGATLWNTLLLPVRIVVSLLTSVVYYGVLSRPQIGLLFFLQNLANTLGTYVDLGIERTVPRFLPEVAEREGRAGVRRVLGLIRRVRFGVLLPVVAALLAAASPLATRLAERQRAHGEAVAAGALAPALSQAESSLLREQASADGALADLLERRGFYLLLAVAALVVIGAFHDVLMQVLAAFFRRREWNGITLAGNLLQPLLVTALVLSGLGVPGVLLGLVLAPLVCLALAVRASGRTVRDLPEAAEPRAAAGVAAGWGSPPASAGGATSGADFRARFARFAGFTWLIALTTWLYDLPFLVLYSARVLPLDQVALLGFAYKYAKDFVIYAFWPLVGLVQPVLARIRARDSEAALKDAYASLVRITWLVLMPAGAGLVVLSPRLIAALYPRYAEGAGLATLFVAFVFAEVLLHVAPLVMMTTERYRAVLASRLFGLLTVPALALLMPRYGLAGAAVAVGVVRLLPALFATHHVSRHMGLPLPLRFGARVLLACAAFAVPLYLLLGSGPGPAFDPTRARMAGLVPLFGFALLGATVFVLVLRLTGGLEPEDRRRLLALKLPLRGVLDRLL